MLRFVNRLGWLAILAFGLQPALGFCLLGPLANAPETWQTPTIGYGLRDIGAPKNLGEEYRWNTPDIYYAFDQNFQDYFASNGVWAVEQAIAVLNGLTNFSQYSAALTEVPMETRRINYRAEALHLYDLKTAALRITLNELGLTVPDYYVWTLHSRDVQPGLSCPWMIYGVVKRSFDPVTWQPSSYINGNLYTYWISEICSGPDPLAVTVPFSVDPLAVESLPVMSWQSDLVFGLYTTTLTRDDVGGLRYIYESTNINWEAMSPDSTMFYTNIAAGQQLLFTSNLTLFASQALTNNAAALAALYPTLSIAATTNIYTNIWVTNVTSYLTNYAWEPYGTPPHTVYATNRTLTVQTWYHHIFNNVDTFQKSNGAWTLVPLPDIVSHTGYGWITVQTSYLTNYPTDPYGTPARTNTTTTTYQTNEVIGEYFIIPTNICDLMLAGLQATLITSTTNVVVTNTVVTNSANGTILSETVIDYFTNHVFRYYEVDCVGTNVMLRQGMDKFTFHRANYDSLVGRFFQPITNLYYLVGVTNSQLVTNWFLRIVTTPDYLYTAQDLGSILGTPVAYAQTDTTPPSFNDANENPGLAGPGNIQPGKTITFTKVGPWLYNVYGSTNYILDGLNESTATTNFIWGTFDGTTNDPVLYPSGTSIANLEAQILFQIVTAFLPDGKMHTAYPATQLQAAGGVLPYSNWTWATGWPSLPPGLSLSSSGIISGTPTHAGTYGFVVSVTGGDARTISRSLSITIKP